MKKSLTLIAVVLISFVSNATEKTYFIDDNKVETVLNDAEIQDMNSAEFNYSTVFAADAVNAEKSVVVAALLDWFLGSLAIHRVYLDGKASLILIYFITCGGIVGIVPLVDFFVMIFGDFEQYIGNDKFIVW